MGANLDITACACERDPHLLVPELALELAYAQIMPELRSEPVGLAQANGRVLASPVIAAADGPPFDAAAIQVHLAARQRQRLLQPQAGEVHHLEQRQHGVAVLEGQRALAVRPLAA